MPGLALWELLSYIVTVIGLPIAVFVFWHEQRKERENEDEETYQLLSDAYADFLKLVMGNPDLQLRSRRAAPEFADEQKERRQVVFEMLISLFERTYLLEFDEDMTEKQRRRWHSWDDYMREWCRRPDFCAMLPRLLEGENPDFVACIKRSGRARCGGASRASSSRTTLMKFQNRPAGFQFEMRSIAIGPMSEGSTVHN